MKTTQFPRDEKRVHMTDLRDGREFTIVLAMEQQPTMQWVEYIALTEHDCPRGSWRATTRHYRDGVEQHPYELIAFNDECAKRGVKPWPVPTV